MFKEFPMATRYRSRILLADDHTLIAEACKNLLEPEFEVVGVVADGRAMLRVAGELRPDVVIIDVAMPQLNGLDAGEQLLRRYPKTKLIFLTMSTTAEIAAEAFRRGGSAYVVKQSTADELLIALRRVLRGESYLSPLITKDTVEFLLRTNKSYNAEKRISGRQAEVLQLLAEGKSMKEIAYILDVKPGTVAFHKYKIMVQLELKSNAQLIEFALKNHMVG
jgi:DNA-binding NarL/FixJ family response regulator